MAFLKAYPVVNSCFVQRELKVFDDIAPLQSQRELIESERNVSLVEVIIKASRTLQELTRYPYKRPFLLVEL